MSLILDALRKSEAERRRGQAPDLHVELPPAVQAARAGRPAWPWLLALAITAMAVALAMTWLARDQQAPAPGTADVVPEQLPDQTAEPALANVAEVRTARADTGVDRGGVSTPVVEASPPPIIPAEPAPPSRRQPEPEPSAPPPSDTSDRRAVATPALATPAVKRPVASSTPSPPPASPSAITPAAAPPATATAVGKHAPLQLAELAAAERRALPPLKISMHMWAPTSAGRFAIIDGARVNEGDRLGEAVVDEITRDGVILAWHGRRVQIPIH